MKRVRKIFVSYRREDAAHPAGRIRDWLVQTWQIPREHVFMDVENILPGADFVQEINHAIAQCDAMIIVISPSWLVDVNQPGVSYPRLEAEAALNQAGLKVIPVLVGGEPLPTETQLPASLHPLLKLNIRHVRADSFDYDLGFVARALGFRARSRSLIGAGLAVLLVAAGLAVLTQVPGSPLYPILHRPPVGRPTTPDASAPSGSITPAPPSYPLVLAGHTEGVRSVAFHPNGELLASGSWDGTVRLWDPATGEQVGEPLFQGSAVTSVAFSSDGRLLASGSLDGTVRLWNPETRRHDGAPLTGNTGPVYTVAFNFAGTLLAANDNRSVRVWSVETRQPFGQPLMGHTDDVTSVAFWNRPDGKLLASVGEDNTVRLWQNAQPFGEPMTGHTSRINSVAISPISTIVGAPIATASSDHTVKLWSMSSLLLETLTGHAGEVRCVTFSQDGRLLASGDGENTVRLWNPNGQSLGPPLTGHTGPVTTVAFSPDSTLLATGSDDKTIRLSRVADVIV